MRHLDLFSGIGGFALAARWAGIETIAFCEKEPFCQAVLKKNFPEVPIHGDVKTLSGESFRGIDLITGGYPCQPFSLAGKRQGQDDDRHLWPEMRRIITEALPTWVVAENVAGHVTMGLDQVLSDLEDIGYSAFAVIVPACAVDAPHRRDRVWIVANRDGERESQQTRGIEEFGDGAFNGGEALAHSNSINGGARAGREDGPETGYGCPVVPDSDNSGRQEQRGAISTRTKHKAIERGCRWSPEPGVGRVAHGIPRRVDRLKGLGNAIVPQVAYEIFQKIKEAL